MIIDGLALADKINTETKKLVESCKNAPQLAMIQVGDEQGATHFLKIKARAATKVGIKTKIYKFDENISTSYLRQEIAKIAKNSANDAIIIELPLPKEINIQYILNAIPTEKDVDVLSQRAQGAFFANRSKILPPAVTAVEALFSSLKFDPKGRNCVVFGYGLLVGKPITHWLTQMGATVSVINEHTKDPGQLSSNADCIVSGVGKPNVVTKDMIKDGAIIIDFGYNKTTDGVVGDVSSDININAAMVTPVPGGVGPLVVAAVLRNTALLTISTRY